MPHFDGTGPDGKGPMTGSCRGYCIMPLTTHDDQLRYLKQREKFLREELIRIRKRIKELNEPKETDNVSGVRS